MKAPRVAVLTLILIISMSTLVSAANSETVLLENSTLNNSEIISRLNEGKKIASDELVAHKATIVEKAHILDDNGTVDYLNSDVYIIERKDSHIIERTTIADISLKTEDASSPRVSTKSTGSVSETKEGRVTITCMLGYERRNIKKIPHVRGKWFGGKVKSLQNGIQVKSITGLYHDVGPYYNASGSVSGISPDYKKTKSFSVAKMKQKQTCNVSRNKYFNVFSGTGSVDAKYTVKYKSTHGGKTHTISVNASVG